MILIEKITAINYIMLTNYSGRAKKFEKNMNKYLIVTIQVFQQSHDPFPRDSDTEEQMSMCQKL